MKRHAKKVNWIPLSDPVTEKEVKLELTWSADASTTAALERHATSLFGQLDC
jgi:hypothetical protein